MATALNLKLKEGRLKAKMRQTEAAEALSVSQAYLSKVERGEKVPTTEKLKAMIELYGLDRSEMVSVFFDTNMNRLTTDERELVRAYRNGDMASIKKLVERRISD